MIIKYNIDIVEFAIMFLQKKTLYFLFLYKIHYWFATIFIFRYDRSRRTQWTKLLSLNALYKASEMFLEFELLNGYLPFLESLISILI